MAWVGPCPGRRRREEESPLGKARDALLPAPGAARCNPEGLPAPSTDRLRPGPKHGRVAPLLRGREERGSPVPTPPHT